MALAKNYWALPGPRGPAGADGTNGTDGEDGYTTTTAGFNMPAEGANVTVPVSASAWATLGMLVNVEGAGDFQVASKPNATQLTLTNISVAASGSYPNNVAPGTAIASNKLVSPSGLQGPAGADGTSGADADAYYVVTRSSDAPTNSFDLGTLTTGLLKVTVAAGVATPSTAAAGTDYQAADDELDALAGLTSAADKVPYFTGSGTAALADFTAAGRALVDDASAAAQRTTLGAAVLGANTDITSLAGLTTPLSVAQGGTAGATAAAARASLGLTKAMGDLVIVEERQTAGTDGGTFTTGAWRLRALNTEVVDSGSHASVAASQITLAAGTYRCRAWATGYKVNSHKVRLYDATGAAVLGYGSTEESASGVSDIMTRSKVECRFTIAVQSVIQLQHYCETTGATTGFGEGHDLDSAPEIYSQVVLEREAG
jgi:hypothetical protein